MLLSHLLVKNRERFEVKELALKVLVVDDSAFMRKVISEILNEQDDIEVIATARNGLDALQKLEKLPVDVVTLDLEMPVLDGLATIERIMETNPLPIVVLSSMTQRSSDITMTALSKGAIDFVAKPSGNISLDLHTVGNELVNKVHSVANVIPSKTSPKVEVAPKRPPKSKGPTIAATIKPPKSAIARDQISDVIVAIGCSTGGPKALEEVFMQLPGDLPAGIVIVQHMPKNFTRSLADRLNSLARISVKEATEGDFVLNGHALVAPGGYHLTVNEHRQVELNLDPPVKYLRPAVDVTMDSLPEVFNKRIIGVILTGMGSDGAQGMATIKQNGGKTIVQDKETSTIFSMPKAVYDQGNADYVLPLHQIALHIEKLVYET